MHATGGSDHVVSLLPRRVTLAGLLAGGGVRRAGSQPRRLRVNGAGAGLAMLGVLTEIWRETEPQAPELELGSPLGSSGGIAALAAGRLDLVVCVRPLTDAERGAGLTAWPYARSPLVIVTQRGLQPGPLPLAEVERLFGGARPTWPDGTPVFMVRRPSNDDDWQLLASLSPGMARALEALRRRPGVPMANSEIENAAMLEERRGSIGAVMLGQLLAERRRLTPIEIAELDGSLPAVARGRHRMAKNLFVVLPADAPAASRRLVAFLRNSADAHALLGSFGHVPWQG